MSAREWTREEAYAAFVEEGKKAPGAVMADEYVGRALLTLRHERDEAKADAKECFADLAAMTEKWMNACSALDLLAAECRAWRSAIHNTVLEPNTRWLQSAERAALGAARAAVDAAGVLGRDRA